MSTTAWPFVAVIVVAAIVTAGDYYIKLASAASNPYSSRVFWIGFALYSATALGWVWIMWHLKLATIGAVNSISTVIFLTLLGLFAFQERLEWHEICGVGFGIAAIVLLSRFQ